MTGGFGTVEFLGRLLRPLVSLALRRGVSVGEFEELVRQVYVSEAAGNLSAAGHEVNVSRLSVATGLNRRDVTRIWNGESRAEAPTGLLSKVIGQWRADRRFAHRTDQPRALSYRGDESEFAELVRSVSRDLNPYTVLFELERIGIVRKGDQEIELHGEVLISPRDLKRGCELLGSDFDDLIRSVESNVTSDGREAAPNHHVRTQYDNIVAEAVPKIRTWMLKKGAELHEEARRFLSRHDKDLTPSIAKKRGGVRVVLGSFSLIDQSDEGSDQ
jgi:hypothetical protein